MNELFKSHGVLWRNKYDYQGTEYIDPAPLCPTDNCHSKLLGKDGAYFCEHCNKKYPCPKGYDLTAESVQRKWEGFKTRHYIIHSLDLPPTKIVDEAQDENYWIQVRLGEKNGRRMAVVYIGEKVDMQIKTDYSQLFIDIDDEQLRFDKSNKNPMKLLTRLIAEFENSHQIIKKKRLVEKFKK